MSDPKNHYMSTVQEYTDATYAFQTCMVVDHETSIKNLGEDAVGSQSSSPHHPDNKIVWYGHSNPFSINATSTLKFNGDVGTHVERTPEQFYEDLSLSEMLIGQNIKFDLLYMLHDNYEQTLEWMQASGYVWDTMIVEYLLSNQMSQFITLDELATKYGGTLKDNRLKKYWDEKVDTEDIPTEIIIPYARSDLNNTGIVFREQLIRVQERGHEFVNLVWSQMDALVMTTLMEYNGMHFDIDKAAKAARPLAKEFDNMTEELQSYMADELNIHVDASPAPTITPDMCNPNSNQQIATVLFGGQFRYRARVPVLDSLGDPVIIKSGPNEGKTKKRFQDFFVVVNPEHSWFNAPHLGITKTEGGAWQVDDGNLKKCRGYGDKKQQDFIKKMLKYRKLDKDLNTYYFGLMSLVWPNDNCIHGNLNHCATHTGRLSSSSPNMQNVSG